MPTFDLEYTICQIQSGQFSMAARSHRQEGGNPQLTVTMLSTEVEWRLTDLEHGVPETVAGQPRVDRVDFYFRHEELKRLLPAFPAARAVPNPTAHKFPPTNPHGHERAGGIGIRMVYPHCRFSPIGEVLLFSQNPPSFEARAPEAKLHLDFETGPARIYGQDIFEVHFGIEADYMIYPLGAPRPSEAIFTMSNTVYATIIRELSISL